MTLLHQVNCVLTLHLSSQNYYTETDRHVFEKYGTSEFACPHCTKISRTLTCYFGTFLLNINHISSENNARSCTLYLIQLGTWHLEYLLHSIYYSCIWHCVRYSYLQLSQQLFPWRIPCNNTAYEHLVQINKLHKYAGNVTNKKRLGAFWLLCYEQQHMQGAVLPLSPGTKSDVWSETFQTGHKMTLAWNWT
jgi:hypothetical protein